MSQTAIERLSYETLKAINQKVGFRLITKFGETGVINLGKAIPIVGGIINGGIDITSTKAIGKVSRNFFI